MPMWRCPFCGTPQQEAARCWVCHRSSTSCATCRDYCHSVAGSHGFCHRDRRRAILRGDEIRACWLARGEHHPTERQVAVPDGASRQESTGRLWADAD